MVRLVICHQPISLGVNSLNLERVRPFSMIIIILLQLAPVTLKPITVVRLDHALESRRRVGKDIWASLVDCEIGRNGMRVQTLVVGGCTGMTEG
jgi:hypothetical protein